MKTLITRAFKIWRDPCFHIMPSVRNVLIQIIPSVTVPV
jgi:hypothetical protein